MPVVAELLHGGENEIGTSHQQFLVRQRTRIDGDGKYAGSIAGTNTQRGILHDDSLVGREVSGFL